MDLIKIWNETEQESLYYKDPLKSTKYTKLFENKKCKKSNNCCVKVFDIDSIDAGYLLQTKGLNPVVLNMSDWGVPGGNVVAGAISQEEELFRRSNYYKTLEESFYPLKDIDTIYSPNVTVFKKGMDYQYARIKPFKISFIAAPAVNAPGLINGKLSEKDYELMKNKIKMLFEVSYLNNHNCIILSAWGCGAYRCPPKEISKIFKEVIEEYKSYFEFLMFAIKGKNENYFVFKQTIEN